MSKQRYLMPSLLGGVFFFYANAVIAAGVGAGDFSSPTCSHEVHVCAGGGDDGCKVLPDSDAAAPIYPDMFSGFNVPDCVRDAMGIYPQTFRGMEWMPGPDVISALRRLNSDNLRLEDAQIILDYYKDTAKQYHSAVSCRYRQTPEFLKLYDEIQVSEIDASTSFYEQLSKVQDDLYNLTRTLGISLKTIFDKTVSDEDPQPDILAPLKEARRYVNFSEICLVLADGRSVTSSLGHTGLSFLVWSILNGIHPVVLIPDCGFAHGLKVSPERFLSHDRAHAGFSDLSMEVHQFASNAGKDGDACAHDILKQAIPHIQKLFLTLRAVAEQATREFVETYSSDAKVAREKYNRVICCLYTFLHESPDRILNILPHFLNGDSSDWIFSLVLSKTIYGSFKNIIDHTPDYEAEKEAYLTRRAESIAKPWGLRKKWCEFLDGNSCDNHVTPYEVSAISVWHAREEAALLRLCGESVDFATDDQILDMGSLDGVRYLCDKQLEVMGKYQAMFESTLRGIAKLYI